LIVKCLKEAISHQAYYQSPMKYGIIFWLTDRYSKNVVFIRKLIRLIFRIKGRASCRNSFKAHEVLTVASTYVLELRCFIKNYHMNIKYNYHVCT